MKSPLLYGFGSIVWKFFLLLAVLIGWLTRSRACDNCSGTSPTGVNGGGVCTRCTVGACVIVIGGTYPCCVTGGCNPTAIFASRSF